MTLLPGAAYERDPTVDYQNHKNIMYTMATCHSLHLVDGEYIGDPLDIKMFASTDNTLDSADMQIAAAHFDHLLQQLT